MDNELANIEFRLGELEQQFKNLFILNGPTQVTVGKNVNLKGRFRLPNYSADPTVGAIGDLVVVNNLLKICTAASSTSPTWTTVGTQT